ncbi:Choline kinase alpha [Chionoecetes opilio]|uniref:Choline kinase alpha n=1 Tax=Chionoecetes opilio TaxID=41210 RepID=A0A8J5CID1_CHIOP|nr:Choline kinase alpha [Chionoecetes opilio]
MVLKEEMMVKEEMMMVEEEEEEEKEMMVEEEWWMVDEEEEEMKVEEEEMMMEEEEEEEMMEEEEEMKVEEEEMMMEEEEEEEMMEEEEEEEMMVEEEMMMVEEEEEEEEEMILVEEEEEEEEEEEMMVDEEEMKEEEEEMMVEEEEEEEGKKTILLLFGGLSNLLYYCALPPSHPPKATEPPEVLLRIYGQNRDARRHCLTPVGKCYDERLYFGVKDSESVAVTDLEYDAQSDTERNDAGRVYYEENEPQIVMGSYMFEPEYEVDEQVLAEPEVHGEDALESVLAESVIFALLSERRLGPRLYGVFPGGRLEQFIPARPLFTRELADPDLSAIIATKMANIHALNVPISKEPSWIWSTMERWLRKSQEFLSQKPQVAREQEGGLVERLQRVNYGKEMEFLRQVVAKVQSPVVFAHNDMQEGNILLKTGPKPATGNDRIALIDFEYCSYNYRGFDLANHFCEWMYEYKLPVHPYFTVDCDNYPSRQKQVSFIRTYLDAYERTRRGKPAAAAAAQLPMNNGIEETFAALHQRGVCEPQQPASSPPCHPAEETLLQEVAAFIPVSHLFWALWSIVQSQASTIPFGYMDYAVTRMDHYFKDKAKLRLDQLTKRKSEAITEEG